MSRGVSIHICIFFSQDILGLISGKVLFYSHRSHTQICFVCADNRLFDWPMNWILSSVCLTGNTELTLGKLF